MCSFTRVITGSVFPTLNRNLHKNSSILPKIANFTMNAMFRARGKNRKFFHCKQTINQRSIGHFVLERVAGSLLCQIALWDCFGVVIAFFIG